MVSESAPKETTLQAYSVELGFEDGGMVPNTHQGDLLNRITEPGLPGEKLALLKLGGDEVLTNVDQRDGIVWELSFQEKFLEGRGEP